MGQALYRKYRSKKLDEVIGQDHIVATLKNALKTGKISHAYLFTGPRGIGKTSVARILAHEVNGFAYDESQHHLDIIEIDAASNRRIDEIRDLRDKVNITPSVGKYKIYIIDEVHMLTKEAFNALLKTLEEPPAHVIFILATTEAHKLPETIISRTQRYSFKPIEPAQAVTHLAQIAKQEKIAIDKSALELIAQHGDGSMRDSISMLDQASAGGQRVTLEQVQRFLGLPPDQLVGELLSALDRSSPKQLLDVMASLLEQGYSPAIIARQLSVQLREQIIANNMPLGPSVTTKLLKNLIDVQASPDPQSLLEVLLLDVVLANAPNTTVHAATKVKSKPAVVTERIQPQPDPPAEQVAEDTTEQVIAETQPSQQFSLDLWPRILTTIKGRHNTLYSVMRMSKPSFDGQTLTLAFEFAFHQNRVNEAKNRQIIADVIKQHTAKHVTVATVVEPKASKITVKNNSVPSDIEAISNIFGSAEVLDS